MVRRMKPEDMAALKLLWNEAFGDDAAFAETAITQFAGVKNVYVAVENDAPVGMVCAVPVQYRQRKGSYLYGLCVQKEQRGKGLGGALVEYAASILTEQGAEFLCLIPDGEGLFGWYEKLGFQAAFGLRRMKRPIKRNLWAQADFDSLPVRSLCEMRARFCPELVALAPEQLAVVLSDLYRQGATVVSCKYGYGIYIREKETLRFIELQALNDAAAENLLEAARQREVIAEEAEITVGAMQTLFAGEGKREPYGMVRFLEKPFDVSEAYLRLMLDI